MPLTQWWPLPLAPSLQPSLLPQESWATAKMTVRCALYMGALKILESPWVRPRLLFPKFLMGFCCNRAQERTYKMCLVSPKFPHVPLGVGVWHLGYEERKCWANVRAISFQDFQPMSSQSTNVTDRQTDRQTERRTDDMRSQDRALHWSASCGKKI